MGATNRERKNPDLRLATIVSLAVLLVAWTGWKVWKLGFFWKRGFLSWEYLGVTFLGVVVFFALLVGIFWAVERPGREGP